MNISSLPAFTNASAPVHNIVWTFLDPAGAICRNSKTLIMAWVARRPSELILKFRRDEPSKVSYLYGDEHTIMTWLILLLLYCTKVFQIFPQGLYTPKYQTQRFLCVEDLLWLFLTQEYYHLPVRFIYAVWDKHTIIIYIYLHSFFHLLVLKVAGVILVCHAPLIYTKHSTWLQNPECLPVYLLSIIGVACSLDAIDCIKTVVTIWGFIKIPLTL